MRRCLPSISQKLQPRELNGRLAPIPAILEERARRQKRMRGIRPASCCGLAATQCSLKPPVTFAAKFSTGFIHAEFTIGVYRRRIDYGLWNLNAAGPGR